jgi:hypothetical protein
MWLCKLCQFAASGKKCLYQHIKFNHSFGTPFVALPCLFETCPFTFKSLNRLRGHVTTDHKQCPASVPCPGYIKCPNCDMKFEIDLSNQFTAHLRKHMLRKETVRCPVLVCRFQSCVPSTFRGHFSRKHKGLELNAVTLKRELFVAVSDAHVNEAVNVESSENCDVADDTFVEDNCDDNTVHSEILSSVDIDKQFAMFFLKLEVIYGIPISTITDVTVYLRTLHEMSVSKLVERMTALLRPYDVPSNVFGELSKMLTTEYPLYKHLSENGILATAWKRDRYVKENLNFVEAVEYVLGLRNGKKCTFTYVPILQTLQQLLLKPEVISVLETKRSEDLKVYASPLHGLHIKNNELFRASVDGIRIGLYFDDFEIVNPLGTARKKHKLSAFYWVLCNIPLELRSTLASIQLCILCKSVDLNHFGVEAVLKHFLQDVATLEEHGIYIDRLGRHVHGTISHIVCDNLAAHTLGGFQESFGPNVHKPCRFCLVDNVELQNETVFADSFVLRTKENYDIQVSEVKNDASKASVYGLKRNCIIHNYLLYFHITEGSPPDVAHDLLEGIVPFEIAICLQQFIAAGLITLVTLNDRLIRFPYSYTDRVNRPQVIGSNFSKKQSIGGNASENRTLLQLLPLIIGDCIPNENIFWELLMQLKDIVQLAFAPIFTESSIVYFDTVIKSHRLLLREAFPKLKFKPKHHFVEHYPALVKRYGPLVYFSTMRFEGKHAYFKSVAHKGRNYKNVCKTLAGKHQLMQAYYMSQPRYLRCDWAFENGRLTAVQIFPTEILQVVQQNLPNINLATICDAVSFRGTAYKPGLCIVHGIVSGLPEFSVIHTIFVVKEIVYFVCVPQIAWFEEHRRSFSLEQTSVQKLILLQMKDLIDYYPLPVYSVNGKRYVTLKHFVSVA